MISYTPLKFSMVHLKINPWNFGDSFSKRIIFQVNHSFNFGDCSHTNNQLKQSAQPKANSAQMRQQQLGQPPRAKQNRAGDPMLRKLVVMVLRIPSSMHEGPKGVSEREN